MYCFDSNHQIYTIDAQYFRPKLASIHLLIHQQKIAIIDTGTNQSIENVLRAIQQLNLSNAAVEYIILTHIHLDHAGGASQLMQHCPNAKLVVHPKGARHMIDPQKLISSTKAVYGEKSYYALYGDINPVDADRILSPDDGHTLLLGDRELTFLDTPGHANHHYCIIDSLTNSAFTGDTLGIAYPALRNQDALFLMPTTTPIQFNPEKMHHSIDRVMRYKPTTLYLTHFGGITPNDTLIAKLHEKVQHYVDITAQQAQMGNSHTLETRLHKAIFTYLQQSCLNEIGDVAPKALHENLDMDAKLNAQGLAFWWQQKK